MNFILNNVCLILQIRCYACVNYSPTQNKKQLKKRRYISTRTAAIPVLRPQNVKPPTPPDLEKPSELPTEFTNLPDPYDDDYEPDYVGIATKPLNQREMDYLVAKNGLPQRLAEFTTSFLKRRGLVEDEVNATVYRKRHAEFKRFFTANEENTYAYCNDIDGLINAMGMTYIPGDWRIFIDGSTTSLKAVLLHKSNKKPSIPLAFSTCMTENYETMQTILRDVKYAENGWRICCDLKVINILQGIITKGGFPKYFCFLCNWDSRFKGDQYSCKDWIKRHPENARKLKLQNEPLIQNVDNILLPPLHIKLGIAKKFVEVAVRDNTGTFECLKGIFPKLSDVKIRAGKVFYFC